VARAELLERRQPIGLRVEKEMATAERLGDPAKPSIGEADAPLIPQTGRVLDLHAAHDLK
jgi:hypothetical protein